MPVEVQVASFVYYISVEERHRRATNAFGASRTSGLVRIKGV